MLHVSLPSQEGRFTNAPNQRAATATSSSGATKGKQAAAEVVEVVVVEVVEVVEVEVEVTIAPWPLPNDLHPQTILGMRPRTIPGAHHRAIGTTRVPPAAGRTRRSTCLVIGMTAEVVGMAVAGVVGIAAAEVVGTAVAQAPATRLCVIVAILPESKLYLLICLYLSR